MIQVKDVPEIIKKEEVAEDEEQKVEDEVVENENKVKIVVEEGI